MEAKNEINNIKNRNILKKIFDHIQKEKFLLIIKYNKNIQQRLNLDINYYKEYSQTYSSIEIEIIPSKNKYDKFININNKSKYYHIYFDNKKEEIKRNYLTKNDNVKKIIVVLDYQIKSFQKLFDNCKCIESIFFKKFFRNNITDMSYIFNECTSLKELKFSHFNTSNVNNMSKMFCYCSSLKELNLSNFDTNNVTNMSHMFFRCSFLNKLDVSNFDTNNVTNMKCMFYGCSSLKDLNLFKFNNNKINMNFMFSECSDDLKNIIEDKNLYDILF